MCICDIGKGDEELIASGSYCDIYIERSELGEYYITASGEGMASYKINYCPLCGKKLSED